MSVAGENHQPAQDPAVKMQSRLLMCRAKKKLLISISVFVLQEMRRACAQCSVLLAWRSKLMPCANTSWRQNLRRVKNKAPTACYFEKGESLTHKKATMQCQGQASLAMTIDIPDRQPVCSAKSASPPSGLQFQRVLDEMEPSTPLSQNLRFK